MVDTIRAVYIEYGFTWEEGGYHADLYDLESHYLRDGHRFWVALCEGRVVGTAALELFDAVPGVLGELVLFEDTVRIGGCDCALQRLYVHPEFRRAGIGSALFDRVLEEARAQGRRAMEIWSDKKLTKAHAMYERYGAVQAGDRICHDPDQSPEWGMILEL